MFQWRAAILDWSIRLSCHSVTPDWWSWPQAWHWYVIISEWRSQRYTQATAEEQLKVCKSTEVEAQICFGQNFTAAQSKEVGCSYNVLTKKNNLSIYNCECFGTSYGFDNKIALIKVGISSIKWHHRINSIDECNYFPCMSYRCCSF